MANDYKQAAASYILRFYDDVANITRFYSLYQSAILELEAKYPNYNETNKFMEKLEEYEKQNYINILQNLRHHINTSYIAYKSLISELKVKSVKEIDELYTLINKTYIIETATAFEYTELMNRFLLSQILNELLETSNNLVNSAYGRNETA